MTEAIIWSLDMSAEPILVLVLIIEFLILWCCYCKGMSRLTLRYCGRSSSSHITRKRRYDVGSGADACELYFDYQGVELAQSLAAEEYDHFEENDNIEIIYNPICPFMSYRVNTDHIDTESYDPRKVVEWICLMFWMLVWPGIVIYSIFSFSPEDGGVYILFGIIWPLLISGVIFCSWFGIKYYRNVKKLKAMKKPTEISSLLDGGNAAI